MGNIISGNIVTIFNTFMAPILFITFESTKEKYTEDEMNDKFEETTRSNLLWYMWTVHCDICHKNYKLDTPSDNPNYSSKCIRKECKGCNKFYDVCNECIYNLISDNCPFCIPQLL